MRCNQTTWLSNKEYLQQFSRRAAQLRVPLSGSFDLTHRCNLMCVHCYLGPQSSQQSMRESELSTRRVLSIIDEIVEAGCLYLLITGGEPLLRKDFKEIYRHAKINGLLVTVFTNGTLITDEILELFANFPPQAVEISIYGATAATHERITGVKGSYRQCLNGIQKLLNYRISVKLKTILMTLNSHEFYDMENMARELGIPFRFDSAIFPCLSDGDKAPLELRVSPEEAIEKEMSDYSRVRQWQEYYEKRKNLPVPDTLYNCGAGLTNFHIDSYGAVSPCLMTTRYRYDLLGSSFSARWQEDIARIRERKPRAGYVCNYCKMRMACAACPAFFDLETGAEDVKSDYLCVSARLRYKAIISTAVKVAE